MNKKFWATTFTLSGTIIGAGILGLPFVFAKSGFLAGFFWLILLGAIMIYINLTLGEITLRTKGRHQLSGYAKKYLGKWGRRIAIFTMVFGIYSALLAYLVGEGESLSSLIPGNPNPLILGLIFWIFTTFLLGKGMKELKKVETYGVIIIIFIVMVIFFAYLPQINASNLTAMDTGPNFFLPIGVVLFALLGFTSIPELREEIKGQEKNLKKAIFIGTLIPIILYILFSAVFVGVLGKGVTEVATLSFGPIVKVLGIFTMFTSYFVLSFSLKDMFKYDLKFKAEKTFLLASLVPLSMYILIVLFDLVGFSTILGIGGVVSAGLTGVLILLMAKKAKTNTRNGKDPEYLIPINWPTIILLSLIFLIAMAIEFLF